MILHIGGRSYNNPFARPAAEPIKPFIDLKDLMRANRYFQLHANEIQWAGYRPRVQRFVLGEPKGCI